MNNGPVSWVLTIYISLLFSWQLQGVAVISVGVDTSLSLAKKLLNYCMLAGWRGGLLS